MASIVRGDRILTKSNALFRAVATVIVVAMPLVTSVAKAQEPRAGSEKTLLIPGISVVGDVDPTVAYAVGDLLAERLSRSNKYAVIAGDDLRQMLDLEAQKQLAGCDDDSCVAEIAGSLDADAVLFGRISRLGEVLIVRMTFFDARNAVAESRLVIKVTNESELPGAIDREIGRYLGEDIPDPTPPKTEVEDAGFPFAGAGLIGAGVGIGVAALAATVAGGAWVAVENPRVFGLDTKTLETVRGIGLGSAIGGGVVAVSLVAIGGALVVVGLVE